MIYLIDHEDSFTFNLAHLLGLFDKVIVSTDDLRISKIAMKYGAEVPYMRPQELSTDNMGTLPVIKHAVECAEKNETSLKFVCCLYATAPFVQVQTLQKSYQQLQASKADYCFTVTSFPFPIQRAIKVNKENRGPLLRHLLKSNHWDLVLVFMANKRATDNIAAKFRKYGFKAESFHGDLDQEERNYTLNEFKTKKIQILFATDIAARGLHIDDIQCIINYDLPRSCDDYIHRIGRTARAGKKGTAISFITHENSEHFKLIQKRSQINLLLEQIEGFELSGDAPLKEKGKEAVKGKRKSKKDKLREEEVLKKKKS